MNKKIVFRIKEFIKNRGVKGFDIIEKTFDNTGWLRDGVTYSKKIINKNMGPYIVDMQATGRYQGEFHLNKKVNKEVRHQLEGFQTKAIKFAFEKDVLDFMISKGINSKIIPDYTNFRSYFANLLKEYNDINGKYPTTILMSHDLSDIWYLKYPQNIVGTVYPVNYLENMEIILYDYNDLEILEAKEKFKGIGPSKANYRNGFLSMVEDKKYTWVHKFYGKSIKEGSVLKAGFNDKVEDNINE